MPALKIFVNAKPNAKEERVEKIDPPQTMILTIQRTVEILPKTSLFK